MFWPRFQCAFLFLIQTAQELYRILMEHGEFFIQRPMDWAFIWVELPSVDVYKRQVRTGDLMIPRPSRVLVTNPDRQLPCHFSKTVLRIPSKWELPVFRCLHDEPVSPAIGKLAFAQRSRAMKAPVGLLSDRTVLRYSSQFSSARCAGVLPYSSSTAMQSMARVVPSANRASTRLLSILKRQESNFIIVVSSKTWFLVCGHSNQCRQVVVG